MPNMIQLFSCRCEPKVRNLCHLTSKVQRLLPKALSQTHVCSNLIWIPRYFKRKAQLSSRQNWNAIHFCICNSLQNTLSFQLANLKSRRNDPSAWKQNDMILLLVTLWKGKPGYKLLDAKHNAVRHWQGKYLIHDIRLSILSTVRY